MQRILSLLIILVCIGTLSAQNAADALRYSFLQVGGTARTIGAGGSLGALGADYSVLSTNPAGLGVYRTSEVVFTPTFLFNKVESKLNGAEEAAIKETETNFNFNNIGVVFFSEPVNGKWKTFNLGIGYNRMANFHRQFSYEGRTDGSYTDRFKEVAAGFEPNELDIFEGLAAYNTGAIFDFDGDLFYSSDFDDTRDKNILKRQSVTTSGSVNELIFALGTNYNEKLMIGATLGIPFIRYKEEKEYFEDDEGNEDRAIVNMRFDEELSTRGVGVNLKVGLIYKLNQMIRLGAAVHTPTRISLTDNFSTFMQYTYFNGIDNISEDYESDPGTFEYKLKTPFRAIGSIGVILSPQLFNKGKKRKSSSDSKPVMGFVSAEVEWLDYGKSEFNFTEDSNDFAEFEQETNEDIQALYTSALNIRLGGELMYDIFRFRLGYAINGTPYADSNITLNTYSLGFGVRWQKFYLDLAYQGSQQDDVFVPYRLANTVDTPEQMVENGVSNNKALMTLGFKF